MCVKKIWIVEVNRSGHAQTHAKAMAADLSSEFAVELSLVAELGSLESLCDEGERRCVDLIVIATLDKFYIESLLAGMRKIGRGPRLVGVLHDSRQLRKFYRRWAWQLLITCGQIDEVWVYDAPQKCRRNVFGIWAGFLRVNHPVGDLDPLPFSGELSVLYFGLLSEEKGVALLSQIATGLPFGYRLIVAGSCPDQVLKSKLAAEWRGLQESGRIVWMDKAFSEDEKRALYCRALCLIAPYRRSHGRASGIAVDAIRHQIPLIYSREHEWIRDLFAAGGWSKGFELDAPFEDALARISLAAVASERVRPMDLNDRMQISKMELVLM